MLSMPRRSSKFRVRAWHCRKFSFYFLAFHKISSKKQHLTQFIHIQMVHLLSIHRTDWNSSPSQETSRQSALSSTVSSSPASNRKLYPLAPSQKPDSRKPPAGSSSPKSPRRSYLRAQSSPPDQEGSIKTENESPWM